ncbi:hypothetical protein PRIPAC_85595 [Pristionchus pacificus]|uniref:ADP ribosylation factor n=1 Tax=Pristionchus pacificus TaxID=54126 RepID=A0A2A6BNR6_PRIPA|nr:hypothetical protein PRIPAC_85595 [Pristionchus pacificus]|eukprot:PDM67401.1 ADP ribosylation factor [Pristionchus pacificus]
MGSACSNEAVVQSRKIDKQIVAEQKKDGTLIKLLLLGTGECGKSTVLKQVRILHDSTFGELVKECEKRIYANILLGMHELCQGAETLHISFSVTSALELRRMSLTESTWCTFKRSAGAIAQIIDDYQKGRNSLEHITLTQQNLLKELWKDPHIKDAYEKRSQLQVADSIAYFLDSLDRIFSDDYSPTNEDYLHLRIPTSGVVEHRLSINSAEFRFIDVGGQRSERKKWLLQFEDVGAIIFLSAISEYDQNLYEQKDTNRLDESLNLFDCIINSEYFKDTTMILFLNKTDLFKEKIKKKSISSHFENFKGK